MTSPREWTLFNLLHFHPILYILSQRFGFFSCLPADFFIYFSAGENWGGEKRRDGKVPLSREGSRRLELNSFRSVVTIKWHDVQWYANNGGKERGSWKIKQKYKWSMEFPGHVTLREFNWILKVDFLRSCFLFFPRNFNAWIRGFA